MNKNIISDRLFDISFAILIGIFSVFILSSLGFIFHVSINIFYPLLALLVSSCTLFYFLYKKNANIRNILFTFLIFFGVLLSAYIIAICKFDSSRDPGAYHQLGIILLENGYNPIYDSTCAFSEKIFNKIVENLIWVETYPKFMEMVAANVFAITKQIESGKMMSYLLMFVCFSYSFYILNKERFSNIKPLFKLIISLAIVFNPVVVAQMFTYYTDVAEYLFFVFLILSIVNLEIEQNNKGLSIYAISSICLLNVKWGGFLFYIVITLMYLFYLLINKENKFVLKFGITNIVVLILTALTLINPVYTNIRNYNNPLYPIYGKDKIDIMSTNTPRNFINKNRFKNLFYSTFGEVDNVFLFVEHFYISGGRKNLNVKLKLPFTVHKNELDALIVPDVRTCGFGVLWSGIVLLSFCLLFFIKFNDKKDKNLCLLLFAILILLTVLNPYSWWARYAPHIWLFPILMSIFVLNRNLKNRFALVLVCILYLSIIVNFVIQTVYVSREERHFRKETTDFIQNILKNPSNEIEVYGTLDMSTIQKFRENNIKYNFVTEDNYSKNKSCFKLIPCAYSVQYRLKENKD